MVTQRLRTSWEDKARSWGRVCFRFAIPKVVLALVWIGLLLFSGASTFLRTWLEKNVSMSIFAVAPVYLAAVIVGYTVISLPSDWLRWKAEVRYGLSRKSTARWLCSLATESALAMVLGVSFFFVVYMSFFGAGRWWWLAAALVTLGGDALFRRVLLQKLVSLRHRLTPLGGDDLRQKLKNLAEKAGSKISTFLEVKLKRDSPCANAMIGGLGRKKAIFLTDTLLDAFSEEELESIVAHELGHDRCFHLSSSLFSNFVWTASALLFAHVGLSLFSPWYAGFGIREAADIAAFPLLLFFLLAFGVLTSPISGIISRRMERSADAFALRLTGKPQAFSTALGKLAELNLIDPEPPRVIRLISGAPSLKERVEMAKAFHPGEEKA